MKQKYVVFRKYGGSFDGWLWLRDGRSSFEYSKDLATRMTLKQASKTCFQRNKEARDCYSFGYVYGYEPE